MTRERMDVGPRPSQPKIYHITHVRNLARIVDAGMLWSDAKRIELELDCSVVGMFHIKQRRLREIEVGCHARTYVGDYVPFYFCPRSIMLYILHKGNHPDLDYSEGQSPIIHLQADVAAVVAWAQQSGRRWAFSNVNAGARYVRFFSDLTELDQLDWNAVNATKWNEASIKELKQAEFLVHESFPWSLVERIGVCNDATAEQVQGVLVGLENGPPVIEEPTWYY